jgi:hypothetical protein
MENKDPYIINIAKLATTAKENKWAFEYDADVDSLYWSKPDISKNARLMKLSEDFALYVTPEGTIEGIFIEYAKNNFVEHNEDYKPLLDNLEKIGDNRFVLSKEKQEEFSGLLESMANKVTAETLSNVLENDLSIKQVFRTAAV